MSHSEIEIKGEKESGSFEEGHEQEKGKLVIKRMAYEDKVAALTFLLTGLRVLMQSGVRQNPGRNGKGSLVRWKNWGCWHKVRRALGSKSRKESPKRESEGLVMEEELVSMGKTDEHTRATMKRGLKQISKLREEEEEAAKELLDEVQDRKQQLEDEVWKEMADYIFSWELEKRRSGTLNAKNWQMVQSSDTKAENLEQDFPEIVAQVQELGWRDGKSLSRCWVEKEEE